MILLNMIENQGYDEIGNFLTYLPLTPEPLKIREYFNLEEEPEVLYPKAKEGIKVLKKEMKGISGI